jgi:hypothetical protein
LWSETKTKEPPNPNVMLEGETLYGRVRGETKRKETPQPKRRVGGLTNKEEDLFY